MNGEETHIAMPASGRESNRVGHRFRGDAASCRVAIIEVGLLEIACKGSAVGFTLDEPAQDALEVRFELGTLPTPSHAYCARMTTPVVDVAGRYIGKGAPAPAPAPTFPDRHARRAH